MAAAIKHPEGVVEAWYGAYKALGGEHDRETFAKHRDEFERLTLNAYVFGRGSTKTAWAKWVEYIGSEEEAGRYFDAVDQITPYS